MTNIVDLRKYLRKRRSLADKINSMYERHNHFADRYMATGKPIYRFFAVYYVERAFCLELKLERMEYGK